ncbi:MULTISPECIES: hypothetical protein [unclassified Micromonospora]|uniref:hypothetical protein n=1 Tax=unclassified Micromonospora TaxID=2617518 RepID=UPI0022B6B140|nr:MULTISPECIES: hypothetical protein [unclassified Micromonospora]MCZ7472781.1 hypothetical protein [Micromonospora sp. WMMC273]WBC03477.1 hypothetical protein O7546_00410 [Micromonospora sp. WMMA1976]
MTGHLWLAVLLLAAAAVAVAWPVRAGRARRLAVLGEAGTPAERAKGARAAPPDPPRRPLDSGPKAFPRPPGRGRDRRRPGHQIRRWTELVPVPVPPSAASSPAPALSAGRVLPVAALCGAVAGALLGGPVAAVVLAAYGVLGARAVLRRRTHRTAALAHRRDLDRLAAVAADLRAGLPADGSVDDGPGRVARLARAAGRLADRTGAPLADLLERIEADARAADRGLAAAAAQAAGARATAWLLAALPLGGIGLGYGIGVDPVAVLLHTPVGAGSAVAAVVLQVGGLLWAERLGVTPGRAA